jgi:hypothetical protein
VIRVAARRLPLAALLLFVAGLALRPMAESDLFFRIKAGQEILAHHHLLGRNLFSFTYPDYPDLDTSWLFEVGAALIYRLGGFPGVVLSKTLVLLGTFAGAHALCRRRGAGAAASALALAAAAFVGRERLVERPHVFSFAGEVMTLLAIDAIIKGGVAAAARIGLCFLAAVAVWANLHAGVFVAPLLVAAAAAGAAIDAWAGTGRRFAGARRLALLAGGSAIALLATPVGIGLYRYLRLHLELPALHPIDEFRAPTWISDAPLYLYAAALAVVVAVAVVGRLRGASAAPGFTVRAIAPALPLAALAWHAVRFGADLALVSAPLMAVALTVLGARLAARWPSLRAPLPTIAVVALLAGFSVAPRLAVSSPLRAGIGLDARELPLKAIAFVNENNLRDRMYNDFETGSYLLFEPIGGYPRHRVFVDPRLPAYPPEMHQLLGRGDLTRDEWSAAMDRYGVETALLAYAGLNRRVAWWDPQRWALVLRGDDARVFVRRLPRYAALIAAREIPATFGFSVEEGAVTQPLEARPAASPVADCEWSRRLGELLFELDGALSTRARAAYARALAPPAGCLAAADEAPLCAWLGALDLEGGRASDALDLFARALARGDRDLSTFTNRAAALEALHRTDEAALAWGDVAARAGDSALARRAREHRAHLLSVSR